jgi:hypothetical protein
VLNACFGMELYEERTSEGSDMAQSSGANWMVFPIRSSFTELSKESLAQYGRGMNLHLAKQDLFTETNRFCKI